MIERLVLCPVVILISSKRRYRGNIIYNPVESEVRIKKWNIFKNIIYQNESSYIYVLYNILIKIKILYQTYVYVVRASSFAYFKENEKKYTTMIVEKKQSLAQAKQIYLRSSSNTTTVLSQNKAILKSGIFRKVSLFWDIFSLFWDIIFFIILPKNGF